MSVARLTALRLFGLMTAGGVVLLDQLIKLYLVYGLHLPTRIPGRIEILPVFHLTFTENHGVSMGIFTADTDLQRWMLVAVTLAIACFVLWWLWRERARDDVFALGLVLGGAIGNILDRVRLGYVVDYADLHFGSWRPFLIFNLADAAITIGVLILLARALLQRDRSPAPKEFR